MPPKKPELTPEEKKALAAEKKLQKKLEKEAKKKQLKVDYLTREVKYGQLTMARHEKNWRQMLINITTPTIKEDLQFAWHNFERVVDCKDFTISLLMDEMDQAEEQHFMNFRQHCSNMDKLIKLFNDRLDDLRSDYDTRMGELNTNYEEESKELEEMNSTGIDYLKMMVYGLEQDMVDFDKMVRSTYLSKIDENERDYNDIVQTLRMSLEHNLEVLWNKTKKFIKDYEINNAQRKKEYFALMEQDENVQKTIRQNARKIVKNGNYLRNLREEYAELVRVRSEKLKNYKDERQYMNDCFSRLKEKLREDIKIDDNHIALMTILSNELMDQLKETCAKGENILKIASVCRKFETQDEKVLPFPIIEPKHVPSSMQVEDTEPICVEDETYRSIAEMDLFWRRVAQRDTVRHSLNEERIYLIKENKMLEKKLHSYCMCLNCPGSMSVDEKKVESKGPPICKSDGNFEMRKYKYFENAL